MKRSPVLALAETRVESNQHMVFLTESELWAIHDNVRQHDQGGAEWDRELATQMMAALLQTLGQEGEAPVSLDESDLWQIDRQVPSGLQVTKTEQARDRLLQKVIRPITEGTRLQE